MKKDKLITALKYAGVAAIGAFLQAFGLPSEITTALFGLIGQ